MQPERVAVAGAGAVGCYFGGMLARAGVPVTLIGRAPHVEAINRDGLLLETLDFRERVSVPASEELRSAAGAHLVLFCVKSVDTKAAAQSLQPYVGEDTVVLS